MFLGAAVPAVACVLISLPTVSVTWSGDLSSPDGNWEGQAFCRIGLEYRSPAPESVGLCFSSARFGSASSGGFGFIRCWQTLISFVRCRFVSVVQMNLSVDLLCQSSKPAYASAILILVSALVRMSPTPGRSIPVVDIVVHVGDLIHLPLSFSRLAHTFSAHAQLQHSDQVHTKRIFLCFRMELFYFFFLLSKPPYVALVGSCCKIYSTVLH